MNLQEISKKYKTDKEDSHSYLSRGRHSNYSFVKRLERQN